MLILYTDDYNMHKNICIPVPLCKYVYKLSTVCVFHGDRLSDAFIEIST